MAKRKEKGRRIDAKGDCHISFDDGSCEIYHKGEPEEGQNHMEITDEADIAVNRRRFMPWTGRDKSIDETLTHRDIEGSGSMMEDDGVPGIDLDEPDPEESESEDTDA